MKFAVAAALIGATAAAGCDCIGVDAVVSDADADSGTISASSTGEFPTFLQDSTINNYDADLPGYGNGYDYGATYGDKCANWDYGQDWCTGVDEDWCDLGYAWCYTAIGACADAEVTSNFANTDYSLIEWAECDPGYESMIDEVGLGMFLFLLVIFPIGVPVLLVKKMKFTKGMGWYDGANDAYY